MLPRKRCFKDLGLTAQGIIFGNLSTYYGYESNFVLNNNETAVVHTKRFFLKHGLK